MIKRSWANFCLREAKPWFSWPRRLATGTRRLSKNSSAVSAAGWPTLSSLRPRRKPARSASTIIRLTPLAPAAGEVLHTSKTMSQFKPLLMKILLPSMTYSSPSRTAVVRIALTSEPPPGSVMATARICSPRQMPGSHFCFCASVPRRTREGAMMSECSEKPAPDTPARCASSRTIAAWPKSPPPPPYSAGTATQSRPSRPALSQVWRSILPAWSHSAWRGTHSRSKKRRALGRNISWSARKTVRFTSTGSSCRCTCWQTAASGQALPRRFMIVHRPAQITSRIGQSAWCDRPVDGAPRSVHPRAADLAPPPHHSPPRPGSPGPAARRRGCCGPPAPPFPARRARVPARLPAWRHRDQAPPGIIGVFPLGGRGGVRGGVIRLPRRFRVAFAQHLLVELAGGQARHLVDEVERARHHESSDLAAHESQQFFRQRGRWQHAGGRLDDDLDRFAHLRIGHADHGHVSYARMQRQCVLDGLRIDVDPARNDHEGLAIGQIQVAVRVEMADVAEGRPQRMARVLRGARLLGVLVVVEGLRVALEIDQPVLPGGQWPALSVPFADVDHALQRLADRAWPRERFMAVDGGEAGALAAAVVLVHDRAPPFDHLAFDFHRTGRGCVDGDAVAAQIESGALPG